MRRTALIRRTALRRSAMKRNRRRVDPVTPELRIAVLTRDGGCLAVLIGKQDPATCGGPLQLDHVKDHPRMGKRAPSDEGHLASICQRHHVETGWATSHRLLLRAYLDSVA